MEKPAKMFKKLSTAGKKEEGLENPLMKWDLEDGKERTLPKYGLGKKNCREEMDTEKKGD